MLVAVRSFLFHIVYFLILLGWCLSAFTFVLVMPVKYRINVSNFYFELYKLILRFFYNIRTTYKYEAELPPGQNYIIMANHESSFDAYAMTMLCRPSTTVLKKELLRIPLFGWALNLLKPISVDRAKGMQSMRTIYNEGKSRLQQGYSLVIFPQGTRSQLPKIGKFNPSAIKLSLSSGYPLLLVAHNAGECLPTGTRKKNAGEIKIHVAKPIDPKQHAPASFQKLVQEKMRELILAVHQQPLVFE